MITSFTGDNAKKIGPLVIRGYNRNSVGDTLYSNPDSAQVKRVGLPLSLTADSTGFVVSFNNITGTFWVKHSMNFQLISQSCGFAPYYKLIATKHSTQIDSLRVFNPTVDPKSIETYSTNGQNVTIFLHLTGN
jgi:hypothetical protein